MYYTKTPGKPQWLYPPGNLSFLLNFRKLLKSFIVCRKKGEQPLSRLLSLFSGMGITDIGMEVRCSVCLFQLDSQHSQNQSGNQTYNADAPDPEEAGLNMILDFNSRKSDSQKCCRNNRTDKSCTIAAYYHGNCCVS